MSDFKPPLFEDLTQGAPKRPKAKAAPTAAGAKAQPFSPVDFEGDKNSFGSNKKLSNRNVKDVTFEAGRFMEEGTLLTNVEEYSKKVRQSADFYAKTTVEEASILKSEAETEWANAKIEVDKAKEEAANIIKEAQDAELEIRRQASEKGYVEGLAQGRQAAKADNELLTAKIVAILQQLENLRTEMYRDNENTLAQVALVSAEKLVFKSLSEEKDFVLRTIESSIKQMEGLDKIKIRVNPVEYEFLKEHQSGLEAYTDDGQSISFKADPAIAPATALIESDLAQVNLNLAEQFTMIQDQLLHCFDERRSLFKPQAVNAAPLEPPADAAAQPAAPAPPTEP